MKMIDSDIEYNIYQLVKLYKERGFSLEDMRTKVTKTIDLYLKSSIDHYYKEFEEKLINKK